MRKHFRKNARTFEVNFDPNTDKFSALEKLRPTCLTVRASCFQKIIDNDCCNGDYRMNIYKNV